MADFSGGNSLTTLDGLFKMTYADNMERLIPEGTKLMQEIPFVARDKQNGLFYNQPVVLGMEHGVTFADDTEGAFALSGAIAGQIKNAQIRGYQLVLQSVLAYSAASRAAGGEPRAFEDATKFLVGNMLSSVAKKLEIELLYGQMEYGIVESSPVLIASNDPDFPSATMVGFYKIKILDAEWAPGIWAGAEKMPIDIYNALGVTLRASRSVQGVNLPSKMIAVDLTSGEAATVVATDRILHRGALGKEFAGIHKILTNTGSLFGIDATQYTLWAGSQFTLSTPDVMSFAVLQQAIARGVEKGLDTDVTVMVNPSHWDSLLTEQAALRMYDQSYSTETSENGSKTIKFFSQNGMVEIVPSIYVKQGYAYCLAMEDWIRIGSTDITFKRPGQGENFFRDLDAYAGYELRCYTDQAVFCAKPGRSVIVKGLVAS